MKPYERSGEPKLNRTLRCRLIHYMLVLTAVILSALLSALFLMGRFSSERQELEDTLELQLDFMERELLTRGENLAAMGVELSRVTGVLLEGELDRQGLDFSQLDGRNESLAAVQQALLLPLREFMLRAECSGAFILLDASALPGGTTRSGLYLQKGGTSPADDAVLLYRGRAEVGKSVGIMPHRKWRMEFDGKLFSRYAAGLTDPDTSAEWAYLYSSIFTLPGTSERAILLQVPIRGKDGDLWGICGFEVSESYFKVNHAQPAALPHLSFFLYERNTDGTLPEERLAAGTAEGYFSSPAGRLEKKELYGKFLRFCGENRDYAGCVHELSFGPNNEPMELAALLPIEDYTHMLRSSLLQTILLVGLLLAFAVVCCIFFAQRFLLPILRSLEQIRSSHTPENSGFQEIDDLFGFLAEQDQRHQAELRILEDEKRDAQSREDLIRREYEQVIGAYRNARREVSRLTQFQLLGEESEAYQLFLEGIQSLTPTEQNIFHCYLEGKSGKEIMERMRIKESTLRYHNHNIYGKLGVSSLKQLLQFAVIMQEQDREQKEE